jgi:hypothetical protein
MKEIIALEVGLDLQQKLVGQLVEAAFGRFL